MSTNSDKSKLPSQKKIYSIDSSKLTGILHPVNDHDTHWSVTLTQATEESKLLDAINNAGWTKVRCFELGMMRECVELTCISVGDLINQSSRGVRFRERGEERVGC